MDQGSSTRIDPNEHPVPVAFACRGNSMEERISIPIAKPVRIFVFFCSLVSRVDCLPNKTSIEPDFIAT